MARSPLHGLFILAAISALVSSGHAARKDRIPNTDLWTDTQYQIHESRKPGFNLLTYADINTKSGAKFVQMDDHSDRESKYAAGGEWFQDSLWIFKLLNDVEGVVIIQHVMYPDRILAVNADVESPGEGVPAKNYLILTADPTYKDQGINLAPNRQYGFWKLETGENGLLAMSNTGSRKHAITSERTSSGQFYKWVTVTDADETKYNFMINAV